ncbi:MAG: cobalamin B12-binding domain-containing protein [Elusimicrobia bacterium]|nr:cobalamin B12-binding domain-containing protein [Elusimicrobiota bacterium]
MMRVSLLTVPFDPFERIWSLGPDFNRQRQHVPNLGITALVNWMEKSGYSRQECDFYDLDLLVPTFEEIEKYFKDYQPDVVGLSGVVSTSYSNVKMIASLIRKVAPQAMIVVGGNMTSGATVLLKKTATDLCVVGDGEVPWVGILDHVKHHGLQVHGVLKHHADNGI